MINGKHIFLNTIFFTLPLTHFRRTLGPLTYSIASPPPKAHFVFKSHEKLFYPIFLFFCYCGFAFSIVSSYTHFSFPFFPSAISLLLLLLLLLLSRWKGPRKGGRNVSCELFSFLFFAIDVRRRGEAKFSVSLLHELWSRPT